MIVLAAFLVGGDEKKIVVVLPLDDLLSAVAVMAVEIDDGDLRGARLQRMQRADGRVVEQAEALARFGARMVPGRADRAERAVAFSRQRVFHRLADGAGGIGR